MKQDTAAEYLHLIPPFVFVALVCISARHDTPAAFGPPLVFPLLNTLFLAAPLFMIAILAARSYVQRGTPLLILLGCGVLSFGVGSLIGGWGQGRFGTNFAVTVHNIGSLLGGACHLAGILMLFPGATRSERQPRRNRALISVAGYSSLLLAFAALSALTVRGILPPFFERDSGSALVRDVVLAGAIIGYLAGAVLLVALHARTRMSFFLLYSVGLLLTAIGLVSILSESSFGSSLSWVGRASQYVGSGYLVAAMIVGIRETSLYGNSLPDYLGELFRSRIRTQELADVNAKLRGEVLLRRKAEEELRLSRDELKSVYDHLPVMVCIIDADRTILFANRALGELTGLPEEKLLGSRAPGIFGCTSGAGEDRRCGFGLACPECRLLGGIEDALRSGRAQSEMEYHAASLQNGKLRDVWLQVSAVRVRGAGGPRVLLTMLEITDRKDAEKELRESEALYRRFIEDSLQGFAIIQDGQILLCNEALCRLSGFSQDEAYAMSAAEVLETIHPEDRPAVGEAMQRIVEEGTILPAQVIRLLKRGGAVRWVEVLCARTTYRGRPALQLSYVDRTEERRANQAYRTLIDHALNGMAILQGGRILFANQGLADICGYSVRELLSLTPEGIGAIVHEDDRKRTLAGMSDLLAGRAAPPIQVIRFVHKGGDVRWVETQSIRIEHEGAPAAMMACRDATAERAAEEELESAHLKMRNLAAHLLRAREEERRKVALEVHDQLGQTLAALKMDLHWLAKRLGGDAGSLRDRMKATIELSDEAIGTMQRIASDLRPRMLDDLGLTPALNWLGSDFARRTKIGCKVTANIAAGIVGGNAATALYRIAQEALANVARHSHADHAALRLYTADNVLFLQVEDDGVGITEEQAAAPESYGLIGMRERMEELGGNLSVSGESGFGTILVARIPIPGGGGLA